MRAIYFELISILTLAQGVSYGEKSMSQTTTEKTTEYLSGISESVNHFNQQETYGSMIFGNDVKAELLDSDDLDDDPQWIEKNAFKEIMKD